MKEKFYDENAIANFYKNKDSILAKQSRDELTEEEKEIVDKCIETSQYLLQNGGLTSNTVEAFSINELARFINLESNSKSLFGIPL